MVRTNVSYHNPINQEENTPLVTILETRVDLKQSTAIDSRRAAYNVDLAKASFGAINYPVPGSQWYLKKISGVWTLMARAPQQNPTLNPANTPVSGDTYLGAEGTTHVVSDVHILGGVIVEEDLAVIGDTVLSGDLTVDNLHVLVNADIDGDLNVDGAVQVDGVATVGNLSTSGNVTLTDGTKQVNVGSSGSTAAYTAKLALTTSRLLTSRVTTDVANRVQISGDGKLQWGDGTNALDTSLYRNAAGDLKTDNMLSSLRIGARLRRAANQTFSNNTTTTISWDTSDSQTGGTFITVTGTTITIPVAGIYTITYSMIASNIGGTRNFVTINTTTGISNMNTVWRNSYDVGENFCTIAITVPFNASDTFTCDAYQLSGNPLTLTAFLVVTRLPVN